MHEQEAPKEENGGEKAMETDTEPPKAEAATPQASTSEEDPSAEQRAKGTIFYQAGDWQVGQQGVLSCWKAGWRLPFPIMSISSLCF
jgi:hypothetical protein